MEEEGFREDNEGLLTIQLKEEGEDEEADEEEEAEEEEEEEQLCAGPRWQLL